MGVSITTIGYTFSIGGSEVIYELRSLTIYSPVFVKLWSTGRISAEDAKIFKKSGVIPVQVVFTSEGKNFLQNFLIW